MILTGLPDFEHFMSLAEQSVFTNYHNGKTLTLLPHALAIGALPNGKLDFSLTLIRSGETQPYGRLDFRVIPQFEIDAALEQARETMPGCVLNPVLFESGFLRFKDDNAMVPKEVIAPMALTWDGLGVARYCIDLSPKGASLLKQCLKDDTINFIAYADMTFRGVSPRLPLTIEFDPQVLVSQLCALARPEHRSERIVSYDALVKYFKTDFSLLPLTIFSGDVQTTKSPYFSATMSDRVITAFAKFISLPGGGQNNFVQLVSPQQAGSGLFSWALNEPVSALRPLCLAMNPFEAAQQLVKQQGEDAVVSEVTVPSIETGYSTITLATSLPSPLSEDVVLGVNLTVAPDFPFRPQKQTKTLQIEPDTNLYQHTFFFSTDNNDIAFDYQPYAVVFANGVAHKVFGEKQSFTRSLLYVGPQSFPITFIAIKAEPALMEIATFEGVVKRADGQSINFALSAQNPSVNLEMLTLDDQDVIHGQAISLDGRHKVQLPPLAVNSMTIGRYSFAEYGYQEVKVTCQFKNSQQPLLIEFQGEGETQTQNRFFSPNSDQQHFGWSTVSIFQCRYRYKIPGQSWSDYIAPDKPLQITV